MARESRGALGLRMETLDEGWPTSWAERNEQGREFTRLLRSTSSLNLVNYFRNFPFNVLTGWTADTESLESNTPEGARFCDQRPSSRGSGARSRTT